MMFVEEINELLKPGYLPMEMGYRALDDHQYCVSVITHMAGCRSNWIDWWFGTYLKDTKTYKEWDPSTHLCYKWDKTWKPGAYIGSSHYGEYLIAGKIRKFVLKYEDPAKYFDTSKFEAARIGSVICGEASLSDGTPDGRIIHVVRETDDGCEMRTRLWIYHGTDEIAMERMSHCTAKANLLTGVLRKLLANHKSPDKLTNVECKYCHGHEVVKNGIRHNSQYWLCKTCKRGFVNNYSWPKMKYPIKIVAPAVYDYFSGNSLLNIRRGIEQEINESPSVSTIYEWAKKLTKIAARTVVEDHPRVSDRWGIDEIKIGSAHDAYLFIAIFDIDTRFILSAKLSPQRSNADICALLTTARAKAARIPEEIITDDFPGYRPAIKFTYGDTSKCTQLSPREYSIFTGNFMKSWHETITGRLQPDIGPDITQGMQTILDGFVFHYNYISLNEDTGNIPAQAAQVEFPFRSWLEMVRGRSSKI